MAQDLPADGRVGIEQPLEVARAEARSSFFGVWVGAWFFIAWREYILDQAR
jgi:hypothetical protein